MLSLDNLRPLRTSHNLKRPVLASLAGIPLDRLREIEMREVEPWFDEACALARCLNLVAIAPLWSSGNLTLSRLTELAGAPTGFDNEAWLAGGRIPLSLALRTSLAVGLPDPIHLSSTPLTRQMWDVLCASERNPEGAGWCPWCAADIIGGEAHLPTCLPSVLWYAPPAGVKSLPKLTPARSRGGAAGVHAWGLRRIRANLAKSQVEMAELMEVHPNYYSQLETCKKVLTYRRAKDLCDRLGLSVNEAYRRSDVGESG